MNYFEAMRLLDKVKEGVPYPVRLITEALILTGDLDEQGMYLWHTVEKTYPMKETELFWRKPKQGKYSELGNQTEITILFVPGLKDARRSMDQAQEIESGPICQE